MTISYPSISPLPIPHPDNPPFHTALPANEIINTPRHGFIDDIMGLLVHVNDSASMITNAILLAIHLFSCPAEFPTPIPHNFILSLKKWLTKGKLKK